MTYVKHHRPDSVLKRLAAVLGLALLTAGMWWGWFAWDTGYHVDAEGRRSGPYQAWQVVGCVICLILVAVLASRIMRALTVVGTMAVAFTLAYALTVVPADDSGLSAVGVALVFAGMAIGGAVVAAAVRIVRR